MLGYYMFKHWRDDPLFNWFIIMAWDGIGFFLMWYLTG